MDGENENENIQGQEEEFVHQEDQNVTQENVDPPERRKKVKAKRRESDDNFKPEKIQKILKAKQQSGSIVERWSTRRKTGVSKKSKKSKKISKEKVTQDEEDRPFESSDDDLPNKQIFRDASSPRKRRRDGGTPVDSSEDSNDDDAIQITGRDLGYNSNDTEDGDTIPLRTAKRKAREYEELAAAPKRIRSSSKN
jgi:hypothetical protein